MLPALEHLLVLQDRDRRIAQLKAEQARIPQEIALTQRRVEEESARLEAAKQQLKQLEADRKKLEIEADAKRAQIAKYRTQQAQIKSNTEYQALTREIEKAEEEIRAAEDGEITFMEQAEALQPALRDEQAQLKALTTKGESDQVELRARAAAVEKELVQLKTERQQLASQADPDVLGRYDRLMKSKGDYAIVPIAHGNCGGCHLTLPPQVVHNAKNGGEVTSCDYCGRILYWPRE